MKPWVRNLGNIFDDGLKFDKQINTVVKSCFFQLRLLTKVKPILSSKNVEKVIHAFITSRLDYCSSLYFGIGQTAISRLQRVKNAAARLLTSIIKRDHITPVLRPLHWLPVRCRVNFTIHLLVFKSLHGLAPAYLSIYLLNIGPFCLSGHQTADYLASHIGGWNAGLTVLSQLLPLVCGMLCPSVLDLHLQYLILSPCWKRTFLIWPFFNENFLLYCFFYLFILFCIILLNCFYCVAHWSTHGCV